MTSRKAVIAARIFTGCVVASVALSLGQLTWHLLARASTSPSKQPAQRPVPSPADISAMLALAPFGRPDPSSAQPTSLALILRGIVLANAQSDSLALIAPAGGRPVSYRIGQSVPGGATLEAITLGTVLLRVNGRLERLDLPRLSAAGEATAASPIAAAPANAPPAGSPPPAASLAPAGPSPVALLGKLGATPDGGAYRASADPTPEQRHIGLLPAELVEHIDGLAATAVVDGGRLMPGRWRPVSPRSERRLTESALSFPFPSAEDQTLELL